MERHNPTILRVRLVLGDLAMIGLFTSVSLVGGLLGWVLEWVGKL